MKNLKKTFLVNILAIFAFTINAQENPKIAEIKI